ncbi:MAG: hypothetical protein E7338_02230 [Clostridiales bacterium]|nr:hypothetical protein [Clostridiales bacterium]
MLELIKQNKNKLTCILIAFVTIIAIVLLLLGSQTYTTNSDDDSSIDSYKVLYEEAKMNYECKIGIREWPAGVMQDPKMTAKDYEAKMNYYEELMDNNISKSDYFNIDNPLQNKETMRHATIGYMMLYIMSFFVIIAALSIPYVFANDDKHSKLVALGASYCSVFVLNLIVFIFGIPFVLNNMSAPVIQQFGINTITTTISIYYFVRALGLLCISLLMCTIGSIIANARKMSFAKYLSVFMTYFIFCIPFVLELGLKSNNYAIIPITHIQFANNIINNPIYWIGVIICIMLGICYYACLRFRKQL